MISPTTALYILSVISTYFFNGPGQGDVDAKVETSGSTPPIVSLFNCPLSLRGKPYSATAAQDCLNELLATGYFEMGHFRTEKNLNSVTLIFELKSPLLTVSHLNLELGARDKSNLEVTLDNTPGALREGAAYTQEAELET